MTTFDNTDLSAAASAIKPQLEIERLITTGAIYNPNTSKKERYEQQVIADRACNQLKSIRRSVGHSGDTGRNTTSLRERYEQQLIADKAENQIRRAAAISKYQLRASLPQQTAPSTSPLQKKLSKSYSRKASDQHSVATASTASLSLYGGSTASNNTEYDLLDNSLFEGDGLSREELATAIEFGFVEYNDYDNETPQRDETQEQQDKDEEYVSFKEGQARAKAKRMAKAEAEEKKRMEAAKKKEKEEEKLRMEAAKKKQQEEEKQRLAEAETQAKKKKEREEEKRRIQERIAKMESNKDKKDWHKTYKEWQMKYAR